MLFSQFPAPATALGPENSNNSTHSRPSRLRRLSNLRNNYRAAVNSAGGHTRSGSNTNSNNTPVGPSSDLHLTRSLTTSNSQPANISHSASSSSTTSSASSSQGAQQQQGHGSRLTQVQSSPSTSSIPSSGAAATTSEGAQTGFATTTTTTNTTRSTNDGHLPPNPTASQIRTGDATSVSSRSPSASALSVADSTASETHLSPPDAAPTSHPTTSSGEAAAETPTAATMTRPRSSTTGTSLAGEAAGEAATAPFTAAQFLPSIRLSAYYDPRSTRPSLSFPPISRTLPSGTETIRVGRYSERDSHSMANMPGNTPSAAPVGFKSKVVSRRHCEFWYENGKWYIKDVKSSSGTFLNHIRLSPPSQESKAFPVNDGDIVQLGIDFKGGEEMIFRCVKMRLELNRGWQNKLNTFNVAAHKRLRTMGTDSQSTSGSSDCSICLNSIAPCQSLFVAPCSHTWHYKCVRSLLNSPQYPIFVCPNCRAGADLEADVEDPAENWDQIDAPEPSGDDVSVHAPNGHDGLSNGDSSAAGQDMTIMPAETPDVNDGPEVDPMELTVNIPPPAETPEARGNLPHAVSEPLPIRNVAPGAGRVSGNAAETPPGPNAEGPITPRNDAGPWVFDGRAGQAEAESPSNGMRSLDAAADNLHNGVQTSSDSSSR